MATTLRSTKLLGLALMFGLASFAASPVPRPTQEFKLIDASGKEVNLTAQKGKVCVIQFLLTTCPHCQATATWLSKMQRELGPGVQVYGVAFNEGVTPKDVKEFGQYAKFPVTICSREAALKYLGISVMDGFNVPQLVVIDKKGVVQAQTSPRPARGQVIEEPIMRAMVTKLLAEK
jgi:peroxiredoxin